MEDDFDSAESFEEAEMMIQKEGDFEDYGEETLSGISEPSSTTPTNLNLSHDFGFIRSCLNVVLQVNGEKRHHIVRSISLTLKKIEALTTGGPREEYESEKFDEKDASSSDGSNENTQTRAEEALKDFPSELMSKLEDGRMKCNICYRINNDPEKTVCAACSSFACRLRIKCKTEGTVPPRCGHKQFSGGADCKSCRFHLYSRLVKMQGAFRKPLRSRKAEPKRRKKIASGRKPCKVCMICEKATACFKQWRCSACAIFQARLIARHEAGEKLPDCDHDGSYAGMGCKGCRLQRLQKQAARHEPNLAAKLPLTFGSETRPGGSDQST